MSNYLIEAATQFMGEAKAENHANEFSKHLKAINVDHTVMKHKNGDTSIIIERDPRTMDSHEKAIDSKIRNMGYLNKYEDQPKPSNTFPHKSDSSKSVTYSYRSNEPNELSTDHYRFKG